MALSKSPDTENMVPVKTPTNMYGNKIKNGFSEMSSSGIREKHVPRRNTGHSKENRRAAAESVKAKAESELSCAKKLVIDIGLMINESKGGLELEKEDRENLQKSGQEEENYQHDELLRELELVKQELSTFKLYVVANRESKTREEKETRESSTGILDSGVSSEANRKGTEELVNEEQAIVGELKRFREVEAQKEMEVDEVSPPMENLRKLNETIQAEKSAENESSSETLSDVNVMNLMKGKDSKRVGRKQNLVPLCVDSSQSEESEAPALLEIITEELGKAKSELSTIREEGFQFKSSMDIIRNELVRVKTETRRLERMEEKTEATVKNLNAKFQKVKSKLETVSASEEKSQTLFKKLTRKLEKVNTQRDTANKEKETIREEVVTMKTEFRKTESEICKTEASLRVAMQVLEDMRKAESLSLKKLKTLVEKTKGERYAGDQNNSSIQISKFEYEYLTRYATGAEDIADKKIAAAQAWIEALKASEKEILMKIETVKKLMNESTTEGKPNAPTAGNPGFEKQAGERALKHWKHKCEEEAEHYLLQRTSSKSSRNKGNMDTTERAKPHKSASQVGENINSSRRNKQ